ncbi:MAG: acylphosphatase [Gallionellaceae bacterium]|nr:MAG: acylphosphatase [Gallionellaceae bacterium]
MPQTPPPPQNVTLHLVIRGRVQGVFFRDSMRREAQRLGVAGWVRNRSDAAVEAVVQGDTAAVDAIVRWSRHGPEFAQVEQVDIEPAGGAYTGFNKLAGG